MFPDASGDDRYPATRRCDSSSKKPASVRRPGHSHGAAAVQLEGSAPSWKSKPCLLCMEKKAKCLTCLLWRGGKTRGPRSRIRASQMSIAVSSVSSGVPNEWRMCFPMWITSIIWEWELEGIVRETSSTRDPDTRICKKQINGIESEKSQNGESSRGRGGARGLLERG